MDQDEAAVLDQRLEVECQKLAELVGGPLKQVSINDLAGRVK
jgi:hypothetical protein